MLLRGEEPSGIDRIYRLHREKGLTAPTERRGKACVIVSDNDEGTAQTA